MELGRIGIWHWLGTDREELRDAAAELDELGYGAIWFPSRPASLDTARELLDATRRMVVATGILSIWEFPPAEAAAAHHAFQETHPGRFLLGLGVSHAIVVDREQPGRYSQPLARMREYLDALDSAPTPVPVEERVLAALGPRMLELSRDRSAGTHPYLVPPEHTRLAREVLGQGKLLAPEQAVVLETDPDRARALARQHLQIYLFTDNYPNNWLRLGFTPDDLENGGSDRLVDALVAWGDEEAIRERIAAHHEAGADHVCVQVVAEGSDLPREQWRRLAKVLLA